MAQKVNGRRVAWLDVTIDAGYGEMVGVQEVNWSSKQEKKTRYGKGAVGIGSSVGNYEATGSIVLDHDEFYGPFLAWVKSKGATAPEELDPFDVTIVFQPKGGETTRVRLIEADIAGVDESTKQGDTEMSVTIDLVMHKPIQREGGSA